MSFLHTLFQIFSQMFADPASAIKTFGLAGVFFIVFAESGLFFGFFFPGDSLLFTAGFLASQGYIPTVWLFAGVFLAAVAGDSVGYAFGRRTGPTIFKKENSLFFNKKYPEQARLFYEKHGKRTLIFARFIPIARTFAPIIAGIGDMKYGTFFLYNVLGALAWTFLLIGTGLFLGNVIPNADRYITLIVLGILVVSAIPPAVHFLRERNP